MPWFSQQLEQSPANSSAMMAALNFWLGPTQEIVIAGNADAPDTKQMLGLLHGKFLPNAVVLFREEEDASSDIYKIAPFIKNQGIIDGKATAYVCENYICNRPVNKINEFDKMLSDIYGAK